MCQVATTIFLARRLGPEAFGMFAVAWAVLRVVGIVSPLGFDQAVLRFGTPHLRREPAELRGVLAQSLGIATASGAVLGLVLFALAPLLARDVFGSPGLAPLLRCIALACPFVPLLRVAASATRLAGNVRYSILTEDLGQPILFLAAAVALVPVGLTAFRATAVAGMSFAAAALLAVLFLRGLWGADRARWTPVATLMEFALPTAATSICWALIHVVDRLGVGALRSADEVGLYQAASQPAIGFSLIASAFNVGFAAIVPRLSHTGQHDELERVYKVSTRWAVFMTFPPLVVIFALPGDVMHVVFGAAYAGATLPLLLLAAAHVINAANGQTSYLLVMAGHQRAWLKAVAILFAVDLVLIGGLVTWLGAAGAALATLVTMVFMLVAGAYITARRMKMIVFGLPWLRGLAAGVIAWGVVEAVVQLAPIGGIVRLAVASALSLIAFAVALMVIGVDDDDRDMLRSMVGRKHH